MLYRVVATLSLLILTGLFVAACGADATPTPAPTPTGAPVVTEAAAPTPTVSAEQLFDEEWTALIAAAQEEGKLLTAFTTGSGATYQTFLKEFNERFGIKVTNTIGRAREVEDRIHGEQSAGRYLVDLGGMGSGPASRMGASDALEPFVPWLIHPEVKDPSLWRDGHFWWGDVGKSTLFFFAVSKRIRGAVYNTNLVEPGDVPQSHADLLDSKWIEKIAETTHPGLEDIGGDTVAAYLLSEEGRDWITAYWTVQKPILVASNAVEDVARGIYAITLSSNPLGGDALALKEFGLPIEGIEFPEFRTWKSGSGGSAMIFKNPPHPNATKLLINWMFTKEGWDTRVRMITEFPKIVTSGSVIDAVPLHTGLSSDYVVEKRRLEPDEAFFLPAADPNFAADVEKWRPWLADVVAAAGY